MKRVHLVAHFSLPVVMAFVGLGDSLRTEPLTGDLISQLVLGSLFYAAPHILWTALSSAANPAPTVRHAGFIASSSALLLVGALSIWGPRDASGLPYQWLVYWPLAGLLLVVVFVGWLLAGRPHADA
jgi:hypothetical protein